MSTELYDGERSPLPPLNALAEFLFGTAVINALAWLLAMLLVVSATTSMFTRTKYSHAYTTWPYIGAVSLGALLYAPLTIRGNAAFALLAMACLGAAAISIIRIGWLSVHTIKGVTGTSHPGAPLLLGTNLVAASIWATLGATLLQNSMSGRWITQIAWLHNAVLISVCVLAVQVIVQMIFTWRIKRRDKLPVWESARNRLAHHHGLGLHQS